MTALRTAQLWKSTLSHRCFVQASVPSWVASALGPQFEAFYLRTSKQASWKPCGVRARNPYVRNKWIRRADTSAFTPSDFYTSMCVYPYAYMHICVINIQNMALSASHEGNSLCVYLLSALKIATLCDWKVGFACANALIYVHIYQCLIHFLFLCHIRIWGKMPTTKIIITLFQEDNIFGTNASLTYGPQIQRHTCIW